MPPLLFKAGRLRFWCQCHRDHMGWHLGKAGAQGTVWESRVPSASPGHNLVVITVTSPTAGGHLCDTLTWMNTDELHMTVYTGWLYNVCVLVAQSCLTLCDLMDYNPPGSTVHGILHARTQEWVAIAFSRGSSQLRVWTQVSCIVGRFFTVWATREAQ